MHRLGNPNGNALLVALIALAVLMVLVVGAIRFTGANRDAAVAKAKGDQLSSCADSARRYLLSQLRTSGVAVTDLTLNTSLPDDQAAGSQLKMLTAHYGSSTPTPTAVLVPGASMGAARRQARDLSNVLPASALLGGQYYRIVVKCQEPGTTRETELEFTFRHGI